MAERNRGLGDRGRRRLRENLGGYDESYLEREARENAPRTQSRSQWQYPDSTRVYAYSYDYDTQELWVRFKKYETPWVYHGVSQPIFAAFDSSPSKGSYINSTLNFTDYRRATEAEVQDKFDHA